jgi:hypothetical protein
LKFWTLPANASAAASSPESLYWAAYWYYSSLALFQDDGPEGGMWKKWNEPMKNALVPNQHTAKDGCTSGF